MAKTPNADRNPVIQRLEEIATEYSIRFRASEENTDSQSYTSETNRFGEHLEIESSYVERNVQLEAQLLGIDDVYDVWNSVALYSRAMVGADSVTFDNDGVIQAQEGKDYSTGSTPTGDFEFERVVRGLFEHYSRQSD